MGVGVDLPFWVVVLIAWTTCASARYTPDWASIDSRPLPQWFDDAKFGIFIHWGIFSVPSFQDEWYWWHLRGEKDNATVAFHEKVYGKDFRYPEFAPMFKAKFFDPEQWASMFKKAGARYVVFTSKHHEGFTNWPSKTSFNWNSMDVGPHRDLVGELTAAVRRHNMSMGLYHSLFEWFNPLYLADKATNFQTRSYVEQKAIAGLRELVQSYHPDLIWSDGDWEADSVLYWGSPDFLAWLYNDSPVKDTVVVNDRWGEGCSLRHGGYYSGGDRQQPGPELLKHKWENAMTMDASTWGYSRKSSLQAYLSATDILRELSSTVAFGGNLLLNVGPTADGLILPIFEERLAQVGDFLRINGEAIYATTVFDVQNETAMDGAFYTASRYTVGKAYLVVVPATGTWPVPGSMLELHSLHSVAAVELLTAMDPIAMDCSHGVGHVRCVAPCPLHAGLAQGNVNALGFSLRLVSPVIRTLTAEAAALYV